MPLNATRQLVADCFLVGVFHMLHMHVSMLQLFVLVCQLYHSTMIQ